MRNEHEEIECNPYRLVRLRRRQCPALVVTFGVISLLQAGFRAACPQVVFRLFFKEGNIDFAKVGIYFHIKCKKIKKNQEYENFRIFLLWRPAKRSCE